MEGGIRDEEGTSRQHGMWVIKPREGQLNSDGCGRWMTKGKSTNHDVSFRSTEGSISTDRIPENSPEVALYLLMVSGLGIHRPQTGRRPANYLVAIGMYSHFREPLREWK